MPDTPVHTPEPSCYGKTSSASSAPKTTPSATTWPHLLESASHWSIQGAQTKAGRALVLCMAPSAALPGAPLMLNTSACPNNAAVSFLSQALQDHTLIPPKYYLSPAAAAGMLKRCQRDQRLFNKMPLHPPLLQAMHKAAGIRPATCSKPAASAPNSATTCAPATSSSAKTASRASSPR